jgi:hypothetical protein
MRCTHFAGANNKIIHCDVGEIVYKSNKGFILKLKSRCHGEYHKCKLYKRHNAKTVGAVCENYIRKTTATIYCKHGIVCYSNPQSIESYYINKCCSEYGHKTCENNPQKEFYVEQQKKKKISFIDDINFSWRNRKGVV